MKSIEQTRRYLSQCLFSDEDWGKVLAFCKEIYGGGNVHRPKRGAIAVTYDDFIEWHCNMPGYGDIVEYGHMIGLVGKCAPSKYGLIAYIGLMGELIQKELEVAPDRLRIADKDKVASFNQLMAENGVCYSVKLGIIVPVSIPDDGTFVMATINGKKLHGVFKGINGSDYSFHFIENDEGRITEASVPIAKCSIELAHKQEGLELFNIFTRLGVSWNPREKKFYEVTQRSPKGEKYWYLNDRFGIVLARDFYTPVHNARYKSGNYFSSYQTSLAFLDALKDLREKFNKGV